MRQPKQQRAVETRAGILRAAAEVFIEAGYAGAGINRILQRAGATAGSLYFHFGSKEGLARAVMSSQSASVLPFLASEGLQRLVDITLVWAHQLQNDLMLRAGVRLTTEAGILGLGEADKPYTEWADVMRDCLQTASDLGELQAGVDPLQLAEHVVATCTGMQLFSEAASTDRADLPQRVRRMWQLLLPGIAVPATAVRIDLDPGRGERLAAAVGRPPAEAAAPSPAKP
ncbi:TetR family transcriptional regulator [Streptomyces sp. SID5785]|uniref:ScbR family autoregulator-binding transcription factor n=1 Tax=Streptomyces sp. SID5785 TaxID=2690309 RepID=UPI001361A128|nr:ScbR family autoregulator-binding transcription factor [Streptomyces sp. SID5785]MZD05573.1 TetR family transcriptional regulator [Streptomyces sp. SID5785]